MVGPRPGPAESNADTGLGKPRRVHRVKMGWGGPQGVPCASGLQAAPERVTEHLGGGRPLALVLEENERLCTVALHFSLPPTLLHSTSSTFTGAGNLGHDCECTAGFFLVWFGLVLVFLGPHLWHMEVPRLEVRSELQLPAYTTATAMVNPSRI